MDTINSIACVAAVICTGITLKQLVFEKREPSRFTGGPVRAHVPGSTRGPSGSGGHTSDETSWVSTILMTGGDDEGHHGGGDDGGHHSCGGSHGCGGDSGGGD